MQWAAKLAQVELEDDSRDCQCYLA